MMKKKYKIFGTLTNLEGRSQIELSAVIAKNFIQTIDILKAGYGAVLADDNGSINVWLDDAGNYRSDVSRNYSQLESKIHKTQKDLKIWLNIWLKKIK
jgi:hypothetical protein